MPLGTPYIDEFVPTANGNQISNVPAATAATANGDSNYTPDRDIAFSSGPTIVQMHQGVPFKLDKVTERLVDGTAPLAVGVAIDNQAATEAVPFSFTFNADAFTNDGAPVTYTATDDQDAALPAWLTFTAATRTFSGTPANGDVGTLTVRLTATSINGETAYQDFDIVVAAA